MNLLTVLEREDDIQRVTEALDALSLPFEFEVRFAIDSNQVLEALQIGALQINEPLLVILDLSLAESVGHQFLVQLRSREELQNAFVITIADKYDSTALESSLKYDTYHIIRPLEQEQLQDTITLAALLAKLPPQPVQ